MSGNPVSIFISYSRKDETLMQELVSHLYPLQRDGLISSWYDGQILPGEEWAPQIKQNLEQAQIILLLISKDFLNSDYCYEIELTKAIERHRSGTASVIPVILRSCLWDQVSIGGFRLSDLQALPKDAKPISRWDDLDDAFTDVAKGLLDRIQLQRSNDFARRTSEISPWEINSPVRGDDLRLDLKLDFEHAVFGGETEIKIRHLETCGTCNGNGVEPQTRHHICSSCSGTGQMRQPTRSPFGSFTEVLTCSTCNGAGKVTEGILCEECGGDGRIEKTRKLLITIPSGVDNGTRLRVSSEGDAGQFGGPAGDLYIYLFVAKSEQFKRDGDNIFSTITITQAHADSGCNLNVNTVDGLTALEIPSGTKDGSVLVLQGRGVPHLGNPTSRGDHLIKVHIIK